MYIPGCGTLERSSLFAFDIEAVSVSEGDVVVCGLALSLRMACGASLVPRLSLFRTHLMIFELYAYKYRRESLVQNIT